jgi:hypothetical protein
VIVVCGEEVSAGGTVTKLTDNLRELAPPYRECVCVPAPPGVFLPGVCPGSPRCEPIPLYSRLHPVFFINRTSPPPFFATCGP